MTDKFVAGPYHVFTTTSGFTFINAGTLSVARIEDQRLTTEQAEATANLLAAAPEMYGWCLTALEWFEDALAQEPEDYDNHELKARISELRETIAKAQGKPV